MSYDPTLYLGTAAYYVRGRPPYTRELVQTLARELGLDGSGRLLDVGCGPGVLALLLATRFADAVALDPDADMLGAGMQRAAQSGVENIRWVRARAEEIGTLDLGRFSLVTFGQSFHWTDRERVARLVYGVLEPRGSVALVTHADGRAHGRPQPAGPGYPPIPHEAIKALIHAYLGSERRAGQGFAALPTGPHADALTDAGFKAPRMLFCPGRDDIVQNVDNVLANYLSTSFAAPHLFGDRLSHFEAEFRAELSKRSPSGLFWDWPGDTEILLAEKPRVHR